MYNNIASQTRKLWTICFNDNPKFVDMYFQKRYSDENNITHIQHRKVVAALQTMHYPMTAFGGIIDTSYISGACTHPDYRNQGIMRRLLQRALQQTWIRGAPLSTLIPAEPWLFDYYARMGYAPIFYVHRYTFDRKEHDRYGECAPSEKLQRHQSFEPAVYQYLNSRLMQRPCCIQHSEEDFQVILADLAVSDGYLFTLADHYATIRALAILYTDHATHTLRVDELIADTPSMANRLLAAICCERNVDTLEVTTPPLSAAKTDPYPLGMARIIRPLLLLRRYAATHPTVHQSIALTDLQLPVNDGYYTLADGQCTYSPQATTDESYDPYSIAQLTAKLFADEMPYMSLMLN
ncbi:MAG: GNAT family N-acetyltransferase [Prevotellaceae bacterium]|jgi:predicted acetyltransferase|nr:GNAT family N-acetyltransferase [Prevotellaceae bacterium]